MIEIFVHSSSVDARIDIGTIREMSLHPICAPGTWEELVKEYGKFKGRILPPDDHEALENLKVLANKFHEEIKIYDVSRILDRIRALKRGIRRTPTLIVQGKKYEGLEKISELIP